MAKKNEQLSRPLVNLTSNPGNNADTTKKPTVVSKPTGKTTPPSTPPATTQS
jgi:hypothetical protein